MLKILIVEDDLKFNFIMTKFLKNNDFEVTSCFSAQEAYESMYNNIFDLVITDVMMPDIDGIEFAKTVRGINEKIPILFVTARDDMQTKQAGFRVGIDDFMTKPIDFEELKLRISAILRRSNIATNKQVSLGNVLLNLDAFTVTLDSRELSLSTREFNIIYKLLSYPNHAFSRAQLLDEFWDVDTKTNLRAVDVYITKLREKFSQANAFKIQTIHGLGYKLVLI